MTSRSWYSNRFARSSGVGSGSVSTIFRRCWWKWSCWVRLVVRSVRS